MNIYKNKAIVIDGVNGTGKTSQIEILRKKIASAYPESEMVVNVTREPSDLPLGKLIREHYMFLNPKPSPILLAYLLAADRYEHISDIVQYSFPNTIHLLDRFYLSSMAHNSDGTIEDMKRVYYLNKPSIDMLNPDLTILLDISPDIAIERISRAGNKKDIHEDPDVVREMCSRFRMAVSLASELSDDKIVVINSDCNIDDVSNAIWCEVSKIMDNKGD